MIKHLYANGDSCMWGQGVGGPLADTWKHSWSATLATMMGLNLASQYTNEAEPGASNDRIIRTTIPAVLNLLRTYQPSEILVVIGWTDAERIERFFASRNKYFNILPNNSFHSNQPQSVRIYSNLWQTHLRDIEEAATRFFNQILLLQSFLESVGVQYVFTQAVEAFADLGTTNIRDAMTHFGKHQFDAHINWDRFLHHTHVYQFHRSFPDHKMSDCMHPDKVGYDRWAKYVYDTFKLGDT